jgi:outer membrane protein OmpA-like peptidoglycan-associated protein
LWLSTRLYRQAGSDLAHAVACHSDDAYMNSRLRSLLIAITALLPLAAAAAKQVEREYRADMHESEWINSADKLLCELQHPIPRFGTARFFRAAGEELQFQLAALHASHTTREAMLDSVSPEWKHPYATNALTPLRDSGDNTPFRLGRVQAMRLLYELESGMRPTFVYPDAADGNEMLRVGLSPVKFRDAILDFRACMAELLDFGFDAIQFTRVHFETDSSTLSDDDRGALDRISEYLPLDKTVKKIVVRGHTDWVDTEPYNLDLSEFRMYAVVDYLVEHGVPEAMIESRFFGEAEPIASNRTENGRAMNRRVSVEVIREPSAASEAASNAENAAPSGS